LDLVKPALVAQAQTVLDIGSGCHMVEVSRYWTSPVLVLGP